MKRSVLICCVRIMYMFCNNYTTYYSRDPAHRNWQIEIAAWNLASFLQCALETCWQRFGQSLNDLFNDFLMIFSMKILISLINLGCSQ